ncbi:hypothetical protein [Corynebacterium sp. HS2168-gen11]|uniref:hypothetical protein n=1 Tax=Corynebacterium sp. HS2168-gen11 TaxID=2974027 RepID=UPI00216ACEE8|nr:hypothetical protein [Corynebacterium sp. HS2168-gen11]MCS4535423.1 hypothetical protein [Corynebacterium sp. HS2168-gen11]
MQKPKAFNNYQILAFTPSVSLGVKAHYANTDKTAEVVGYLTVGIPHDDPAAHTPEGIPTHIFTSVGSDYSPDHIRVEAAVMTIDGEVLPARQTAITKNGEVVNQYWNTQKVHQFDRIQ